jgi:hypothetical protein
LQFLHETPAYNMHANTNDRASPNGDIIMLAAARQVSIIPLALQSCSESIRLRILSVQQIPRRRSDNTDVRIEGASPIADKGTPVERRGRKTSGPRGDLPG